MINNIEILTYTMLFLLMATTLLIAHFGGKEETNNNTNANQQSNNKAPNSIENGGLNFKRDIEFLDAVIEDEWGRQLSYIQIKKYNYMNNDEINELVTLTCVNIRSRLSNYYMDVLRTYFTEQGIVEYIFDRSMERALGLAAHFQKQRFQQQKKYVRPNVRAKIKKAV